MRLKKLTMFLIVSSLVFGNELELANIEKLREQNLLSQEDYMILKAEILGSDKEIQYTLKINGSEVDNFYPIVVKSGKNFFNLEKFLMGIGIINYYEKDSNRIKLILGENLRKIEIDPNKKTIIENGKNLGIDTEAIIILKDKIYIREDLLKKLFAYSLRIDEESSLISVALNFSPPDEVLKRLELKAEALRSQKDNNILVYESERKLFDLGYMRVQANKIWRKNEGESSYENTWDGNLEYQGGLFYGQFQANYDVKENELKTARLEYNEIWQEHTLQIENSSSGEEDRTWSFNFFKDKSYYTEGKSVVIRESVPIGSRAELRYMGSSIAIKNEENGEVIFDEPVIKTDRTYTLILYTPDGEIYEKTIRTVEDFDLQNKGEIQYNINVREDNNSKKYSSNIEIFYGFTDRLTLGVGYTRGIEKISDKYEYVQDGSTNIVYGDTVNGLSYVTRLNFGKSFDNYRDGNKKYEDRYNYDGLIQLRYDNWKYTFENSNFGKYYENKKGIKHEIQYDINDNLRLSYDYSKLYKYEKKNEKDSNIVVSVNKSIGRALFSADYSKSFYGEDEYSFNVFYTTKFGISTRFENKWTNSGKDYETILSIYNNNFKGFFDYNIELGYSPEYKDRVTFGFTMRIADWFETSSNFDKLGNSEHKFGIDKIIDLKNPTINIDNMDNSRVKVITFVDENNNNIFDKREKVVEGVEVTLGEKTIVTDKNGKGMFYGISNGIIHDLKPTIKKPSFTLGENKLTVRGTFASTIEAQIPIKPMLNLTGEIVIEDKMELSDIEKEALYQDLLIEIKDIDGKSIELAIPDNTGIFDISGLYPEKYILEITYLGNKYDLKKISEILKLDYRDESFDNNVAFQLSSDKIEKID